MWDLTVKALHHRLENISRNSLTFLAAVWLGQVSCTKEIELGESAQIQLKKELNYSMLSFITINFRIKTVEL